MGERDDMPARLLICARDMGGSGPGRWLKGQLVAVVGPEQVLAGAMMGLPDFIVLEISDADVIDLAAVRDDAWNQNLDWDVVSSDLSIDGHRLLLWTTNRRASDGLGDITVEKATAFLQNWAATNIIFGTRPTGEAGVRFDAAVFAAATSQGFWLPHSLTDLVASFSELSYTQSGGIHDIRLTYVQGLVHAEVVAAVAEKAIVLASNAGQRRVDFRLTRLEVLDAFKASVKAALQGMVRRRRLYFDPAAVDQAIAAGGTVTRTLAQAQSVLRDAMDD